jgi:hypothetical protein
MFWKDIVDEGLLLVLKFKKKKTIEIKNYDILPRKHKCIDVAFLSSCNIYMLSKNNL